MQPVFTSMAALAVASIFYTWRAWQQTQYQRERTLRERVAYMLWIMATREEQEVATLN
jgi:hypothetical protein